MMLKYSVFVFHQASHSKGEQLKVEKNYNIIVCLFRGSEYRLHYVNCKQCYFRLKAEQVRIDM